MKQIRTAALRRHIAPSFLIVAGLELMQLRKLPWISRVLFFELVALADPITGQVETSYAVLEALLDFDLAPTANDISKPTHKRVRNALVDLVELRLVKLDRIKNEKAKGLFLKVKTRVGITASADKQGRLRGRPKTAEKPATARLAGQRPPEAGQTAGQGIKEKRFTPLTPQLSTPAEPLDVGQLVAQTKRRINAKRLQQSPSGG